MGPPASIIIVATRDSPRLRQCLERLAGHESAAPFETIVVLTGTEEPDLTRLGLTLITSPVNLGLAEALNLGSEVAQGEFLVSLHDDAEPHPGWLDALVAAAHAEPDAGAIGSLVLNPDGSVQAAGWVLEPDGSTRPPWNGDPPLPAAFEGRRAVDYSPSCSLLIRRSAWDEAGGADERFFPMYYVDVDLCLALRARGQRVLCEPASVVVHERGASIARERAVMISERNRDRLRNKWDRLLAGATRGDGELFALTADELPTQERSSDPQARERRALENQAQLAGDEAAALRAERDAVTDDLKAASARVSGLEAQLHKLHVQLTVLKARSEKLGQIEAGGWWQLRGRLLPLLRMTSPLRRRLRRRRGSATPDRPVEVDE